MTDATQTPELSEEPLENFDDIKEEETKDTTTTAAAASGDDLFVTETVTKVERLSVLPFKGAIVPPSTKPTNDSSAPKEKLVLDWVYGYRGYDANNNVVMNSKGHVVYPAAGVVVVYDPVNHAQRFYRGHNDDVMCLAQNPSNPDQIATGQTATLISVKKKKLAVQTKQLPHICVWNSTKFEDEKILQDSRLKGGVLCLAFSADGKYLASVNRDDDQTVLVWDVKSGKVLAAEKGDAYGTARIFGIAWSHVSTSEFVTVGQKHIYNWTFSGSKVSKKRMECSAQMPLQTFFSVCYSEKGAVCAATRTDGSVYAFVGGAAKAASKALHKGACLCVGRSDEGIITGGEDGNVNFLDKGMKTIRTLNFPGQVRSIYVSKSAQGTNDLLVGTGDCDIFLVKDYKSIKDKSTSTDDAKSFVTIMRGHSDGETWGLAVHPTDSSLALSSGEDNRAFMWDLSKHRFQASGVVNSKAGARPKVRKAATDSLAPTNQCARGAAFSPDGKNYALGTNAGEVNIYDSESMKLVASVDLNQYGNRKIQTQTQNWIEALAYSPDGSVLAVATHGFVVCLLDVASGYKVKKALLTQAAPILMDWSADSNYIQVVTNAWELLFFSINHSDLSKSNNFGSASAIKDVKWATQTCIFNWGTAGIYDPIVDFTDLNQVDKSPSGKLIASADDFGYVKVYRFPVLDKNNKSHGDRAHSSHVKRVKFTADEKYIMSAGGYDKTVMQWKLA